MGKVDQALLIEVLRIAHLAGDKIATIYHANTELDVQCKQDLTPVTIADVESHNIISKQLKQLTPDIPCISEEAQKIDFSTRQQWQRYWLVDPLDGTKEFIYRTDEFCICIALIDNHEPILGVVYLPILDLSYFAVKGEPAYKQQGDASPEMIQVRDWDIAHTVMTVSRRHTQKGRLTKHFEKAGDYVRINAGSALKFGLVSEGKADIYPRLGPTNEWDTAAGQCVVEAAGGKVLTRDFKPLRYNTKDSLLNPHFMVLGDWHNLVPFLQQFTKTGD